MPLKGRLWQTTGESKRNSGPPARAGARQEASTGLTAQVAARVPATRGGLGRTGAKAGTAGREGPGVNPAPAGQASPAAGMAALPAPRDPDLPAGAALAPAGMAGRIHSAVHTARTAAMRMRAAHAARALAASSAHRKEGAFQAAMTGRAGPLPHAAGRLRKTAGVSYRTLLKADGSKAASPRPATGRGWTAAALRPLPCALGLAAGPRKGLTEGPRPSTVLPRPPLLMIGLGIGTRRNPRTTRKASPTSTSSAGATRSARRSRPGATWKS